MFIIALALAPSCAYQVKTHSDIGIQLHSVPTLGRKVMERHGERVGKNCMVEQCLHSDSQCGCKSAVGNLFEGRVS